ncbi:hypothetical protein Syun_007065 [Stephania yunnanensis]|uniref:Uncharacterized protein n=1 Tax=Stephania yunnanensis TaxID=152371 RepID=A0AAP0L1A6_9MAGN
MSVSASIELTSRMRRSIFICQAICCPMRIPASSASIGEQVPPGFCQPDPNSDSIEIFAVRLFINMNSPAV